MAAPADLDLQLSDARDALEEVRRQLLALNREYAVLKPSELAIDDLGEPLTPSIALTSARDALDDAARALAMAADAFDVAQRYSTRLMQR